MSHPAPAAPAGSLVPFGVLSLAYYASVGVFNPYTPLWFQSLGFSTLAIGAIASLQAWSRVVAPYAWSWIGDHWAGGTRRVDLLRLAALLALLASLGLLAFTDVAALSIVVLLIFLANGAVLPLSEATLSQRLATTRGFDVGRYGRVRVWGSVGFIVAVTVCGVLLQFTGIAALPGLVVLVYALLMFAAWRLPRQSARLAAAHDNAGKGVWQVLRQPVVAWFMTGVFFTVLSHTSLYAFLSLYLDSLGYSNSTIGVLWAVSVAAEIVFFWTQGRWFAIWPATTLLVAAALASALRFGAMATLGGSLAVLVLAQSMHALTFAAQHASCISMIDRYFSGPLRGRGQALYSMLGYGASGVIGGVAGGAISQHYGFEALFAAAALVALASAGCCWRCLVLARRAGQAPGSE